MELPTLVQKIVADVSGYEAGFNRLQGMVDKIANMSGKLLAIGVGLTVIKKGVDEFTDALKKSVSAGMEMQRMEAKFGVLLGSIQKGKAMLAEIQAVSTRTPFSASALATGADILMGMGVEGEKVVSTLKRLGDVAGGDTDRLKRLAIVYGEVMAEGKITGWRIRQFASLGIGVKDFAETMGVRTELARPLMAGGFVDSELLPKTINRLSSPGGRFYQGSTAQLDRTVGQWERLGNVVEQMYGKIGMAFLDRSDTAKMLESMADAVVAVTPVLVDFAKAMGELTKQFVIPLANSVASFARQLDAITNHPFFRTVSLIGQQMSGNLGKMVTGAVDKMIGSHPILGPIWSTVKGIVGTIPGAGKQIDSNEKIPEKVNKLSRNTEHFVEEMIKLTGLKTKAGLNIIGTGFTPLEKFSEIARQAYESVRGISPEQEKFVDAQRKYMGLATGFDPGQGKNFGPFADTPEKANRGLFMGYQTLRNAILGGDMSERLPKAMQFGSADAQDTINKNQVDNISVMDEILTVLQGASEMHKQSLEYERQFVDGVNGLKDQLTKAGIQIPIVGVN